MLDDFIKEYDEKFLKDYGDDFFSKLQQSCDILEEFNNPVLNDELKKIKFKCFNPVNVGIIGEQKFQFLNAFFKKNILPTGELENRMVYIKYAPLTMIRILYLDGSYEFIEISKLYNLIDKKISSKILKIEIFINDDNLKYANLIYLPNEGYINQDIDLIFLLSSGVNFNLKLKDDIIKNTIFLFLKDKNLLDKEQLANFKEILEIDLKARFENKKNSGFEEIFQLLIKIDKKQIIKNKFNALIKSLIEGTNEYIKYYDELRDLLSFSEEISDFDKFQKVFKQVEDYTLFLANELKDRIKTTKKFYYKEKQIWKFKYFTQLPYTSYKLEFDDKKFKGRVENVLNELKDNMNKHKDEILSANEKSYNNFKDQILFFRSKYELLSYKNKLIPDFLYLDFIRSVAGIYEKFLKDFDCLHNKVAYKINIFFNDIDAKSIDRFKELAFIVPFKINEEILKSELKYESNPDNVCIYNPSIKEIQDLILKFLDLQNTQNQEMQKLKSIIKSLNKEIKNIISSQIDYINSLKENHLCNLELFNKLIQNF